ncbi:thyrotropin-releasing hormone receptor [Aplysia californica]|uniref:Thyrotropin-releasing hormone receptor n=1 Tax=Aplysia californica TaxID=6500 RepID=A0ABM1W456_APLCA|nr:thyrotropin-releasing hormone receptor [Aplysia californica]
MTPFTGGRNLMTFSLDDSGAGLRTTQRTTQFVPVASDEVTNMFKLVNFVILCGLLSPFGLISNVINIVVFVKLGFHDSMNISLMGLAVSDLVSLVSMVYISLSYNPLFVNAGLPFDPLGVQYMVGGGIHVCFARITSLITAFITFERCLCIAMPLKVKLIITPTRTKLIIFSIFAVMFVVFSPFYFVNKLTWELDADRNATILTHTFTDDRIIVETITFLIHGVIFSVFCFVLIICCTVILVVKLNSKTKWREATAAKGVNAPEGVGVKDKRVVKMVTFISSIFIVCFFPATVILLALALVPDLGYGAKYENMWFVLWSISCLTETVNSSVNILVYLKMSSKFRAVFMKTFLNREEK